jgi:aminoglycoside phosphotransferase family enzyme
MSSTPRQGRPTDLALEAKVEMLRLPDTYPEKPGRVETVETHMSWVFLTDRYAYKMKKPVRYDFLDFSTLALRRHNCEEEVRLNRRLAADVYLGAVAIVRDVRGGMRLGGEGEPVEWLVKMRRLPAERMLDAVIRRRALREPDIRRLASLLVRFYLACSPAGLGAEQYRTELGAAIELNRAELSPSQYDIPHALIVAVHGAQSGFLRRQATLFDARVAAGKIIEGHGDLRPEHVCLLPEPVVIDCLEFSRRLRLVDPVDELAFLSMECERLAAPQVGEWLLDTYRQVTQDRPPATLVNFYKSYRASLRARFAIAHLRDLDPADWPKWRHSAVEYLRMAERYGAQLADT